MELTILVPVLGEATGVARLCTEWEKLSPSGQELVFISGDSPGSPHDLSDRVNGTLGARWLFQRGRGIADAWKLGMLESTGDWIATMDGDGAHSLTAVSRLLNQAKRGYDLVIASRTPGPNYMPGRLRRDVLASRLAARLFAFRYRLPVRDPFHGFRVRSRRLVDALTPQLTLATGNAWMGAETQGAHSSGFLVSELEIPYEKRWSGRDNKKLRSQFAPFFRELCLPRGKV